ncbi:MAG: P22 phage major capsid protein family protein [Alphaproteobacteria bacterium]|jgi:hypothetical protein|nr:P22 phage major capsid protein family protein [Alphaproteobacteria bacterium]MDP6516555.1 P22 phage major capsid protein family protein [Alphaproteobacteria bacterium]
MASNTLTNILDKILARNLMLLRENAVMPRLVNIDFSEEAARPGATIDIPISKAQTVADVTPGPVHASAQANTPGLVQVPMAQHRHTDFFLTDREMMEVDRNQHFVPGQMEEAVKALANDIDDHIHSQYTGIYGFVGTAGTVPFSTVTTTTDARKTLNNQLAPNDGRWRIVMDPDAEAQALQLAAYADISVAGDRNVPINGEIGRKLGFDHFMSQNVTTHTAGSIQATGLVVGSATAAGASSVDLKSAGATGNLLVGDIFTVAGDTQTYVVQATVSAIASGTAKAVTIDPPLTQIASANDAVTVKATHVVNLAFQRNAIAFVTRPLERSVAADLRGGNAMQSVVDPQTGLTLRLEVIRQNKQDSWDLDVLYGAKLVRPEFAARIAG